MNRKSGGVSIWWEISGLLWSVSAILSPAILVYYIAGKWWAYAVGIGTLAIVGYVTHYRPELIARAIAKIGEYIIEVPVITEDDYGER